MKIIENRQLAGPRTKCFNPGLIAYRDKVFLFYRFTSNVLRLSQIGFVELGLNYKPRGSHRLVNLPKLTERVVTFDDPRVFVWRDQLWLMHVQASSSVSNPKWAIPGVRFQWSTTIVLSQIDLEGRVYKTLVPKYGHNWNYAMGEFPPATEKNWTPLVVDDELYMVYLINPLIVIKFQEEDESWVEVVNQPWKSPYSTFLGGSTPLIPLNNSEYIALFHTFEPFPQPNIVRIYKAGFWTLDVKEWSVKRISLEPVLDGTVRYWKLKKRLEPLGDFILSRINKPNYEIEKKRRGLQVVFPCGIVEDRDRWIVSFGKNDAYCCTASFQKKKVLQSLFYVERSSSNVKINSSQ